MSNLSEFDPDITPPEPPRAPEPARAPLIWIAAAVVLVAVAAGVYFWLGRTPSPAAGTTATEAEVPATPLDRPLGGDAEAIAVPPLDESDALVRTLVAALSSHPQVAAWLTTNGLIRNFVVVVENISTGATPSGHLRPLRPAGTFRVLERDGDITIDPRNYDRYSGIAGAVDSVDAAGAAKLYATLKPRIEEAYADLGRQDGFDRALERALVSLLRVPVPPSGVRIEPSGAVEYEYVDPRLARLTGAQKQLVRMGPRNVAVIQGKLREIALALGIPAERLR